MNDDMINEHQDIIKTFDLAMFPTISWLIIKVFKKASR